MIIQDDTMLPGLTFRTEDEATEELIILGQTMEMFRCPLNGRYCDPACLMYRDGTLEQDAFGIFTVEPPRCLWVESIFQKES